MRTPLSILQTIPASGTVVCPKTIPLVRTRTLSITTRLTFGGAIDADATVYVYHSPDGNNWDTIALTSWAIAFTINVTKQVTKVIDVPEHGYIMIKITNGSSADTITQPTIWYTIQSWDEIGTEVLEHALQKALEKQISEETGPVG